MIYENKKIKAFLFDFDGVLVDSMHINFDAWAYVFKKKKVNLVEEDYFPLEGMKIKEIAGILSKKYNIKNVDLDKIIREKEQYFIENYKFLLYPGVVEFIDSLKKSGILTSIVSAAHKDRMFSTTPKDFLEKFDCVITGDEVERGKPFPDPYLKAMKKLDVKPEECIVIENAPFGIKSAKNAKVTYCIGICSTLKKERLYEADEIIERFSDLNTLEKIVNLIRD